MRMRPYNELWLPVDGYVSVLSFPHKFEMYLFTDGGIEGLLRSDGSYRSMYVFEVHARAGASSDYSARAQFSVFFLKLNLQTVAKADPEQNRIRLYAAFAANWFSFPGYGSFILLSKHRDAAKSEGLLFHGLQSSPQRAPGGSIYIAFRM